MRDETRTGHHILELLYLDQFGDTKNNLSKKEIADKIDGVDEDQVHRIIGNLGKADLVASTSDTPKISKNGIELVLSMDERDARETHRDREHDVNRSIQFLTVALVLTGGLRAVALHLPKENALIYSLTGACVIFLLSLVALAFIHYT